MDFGDRLVHTEALGSWSLQFHEVTAPDGAYLCSYVEVRLEDARKCRLSLVKIEWTLEQKAAALRRRAHEWISDWQRRDHTGNTGFADL
ncbi:hypothetical protein ACO2Q9_18770 [Variovorax sp. VNK109]|jgi:hypothetical protein|uniref:hypothetical protein n=1 Tax=Variovorax sp. VNK109 TaxID=3400919 RepID=UPI003C076C06